MLYRVAAIKGNGETAVDPSVSLEEAQQLFSLLDGQPWGPAVALEIQCSIDGVEWDTLQRRDRDGDSTAEPGATS